MDGGVVLGGSLRACINGTDIVEVKARKNYDPNINKQS